MKNVGSGESPEWPGGDYLLRVRGRRRARRGREEGAVRQREQDKGRCIGWVHRGCGCGCGRGSRGVSVTEVR